MEEADGGCFGKLKHSQEDFHCSLKDIEMDNSNNNNEGATAIAPIARNEYYYKMDHSHRGLLIIFNHENFNSNTKQSKRSGTDQDVTKIKETFESLGFEGHVYKDLTLHEIKDHIRRYVRQDHYHKRRDCLAIFVLTHGDKDVLWAKDTYYNPAIELWEKFAADKCPSLAGKPKLVFLQACQGQAFDKGVKLMLPRVTQRRHTEFDGHFFYELPVNADFLVFYATYEGFYAFRNDRNGSFWVTLLCEELQKHHKKTDLLTILTFVNRRLAVEFSSVNTTDQSKHGNPTQ